MATGQNIEDMKLFELKQLAKQMGLRGTSTMRKQELVATLQAARNGDAAPSGVSAGATASEKAQAKERSARSSVRNVKKSAPADESDQAQLPIEQETARDAAHGDNDQSNVAESQDERSGQAGGERAREDGDYAGRSRGNARVQRRERNVYTRRDERDDERSSRRAGDDDLLDGLNLESGRRRSRESLNRGHNDRDDRDFRRRGDDDARRDGRDRNAGEDSVRDLDDILATLPKSDDGYDEDGRLHESHGRDFARRGRQHNDRFEHDNGERRQRRLRGRNGERDMESREGHDRDRGEREDADLRSRRNDRREEQNDGLVPVAGIIDVMDSYAFVRTSGYLPGPNDVYVSMGQIRKYGLRKGDAVTGSIRPPREGEQRRQRQKFVPLQNIDTVNGTAVEEVGQRPNFSKLTPLYPQERLKQETAPNKFIGRLIDLVSPIGKGQRGLIVSPPKAGKTITLQNIANSISENNPEVHLMVVLVDERPEEVTDMERTVQGEVISSTFDRPASDHTAVAELAIERAKRLVELGQDVVVLLDSMTRLARAYNIAAPASGRILSGGVDAQALYPPKKFFGAARNIENGGSLTIIASALVETGSKMDEVIFEEFKGTGNMELRLNRELADKRLFPAIDVNASGTRREELITPADELAVVYRLRRLLGGMEPEQAYQTLVPRMKKTATNRDFLQSLVQQQNG